MKADNRVVLYVLCVLCGSKIRLVSPAGAIGLVIVAIHPIIAIISPVIVPYEAVTFDTTAIMQPPTADQL